MGMEDDEVEVGGGQQSVKNGTNTAEVVTITANDFLRMEFNNPKEAACIYEEYSRVKGFAVRQGKKTKNKRGKFVRITYLCNRKGFWDKKLLEKQDRKREHKVITRCGCPTEIQIKPRIDTEKRISDVDIVHMNSLRQVGISIPKIYESIAVQARGFNRVSFTKRDMYNEVRRQRSLQNGDVNAALRFLEVASRRDEKMYWRYEVGLVNTCVTCSRVTVVVRRISNYSVIFLPSMLRTDETNTIFQSLFSLGLTITTRHVHCMLADIKVEEFELQWEAMVSECGVKDYEWVKDLYSKKLLWAEKLNMNIN
ncbi:hypothetical protein Ahy_A10g048801 [Arachis hypogaea]|uniref:FAR1 domain-containing protein n=1 Tax=Arachis hypogaea TaxID=3818 RepID=A0A445B5X6_ARAHY|nr:hypothetical protein Ahy_A10g048801 [Arachis hypogaea]